MSDADFWMFLLVNSERHIENGRLSVLSERQPPSMAACPLFSAYKWQAHSPEAHPKWAAVQLQLGTMCEAATARRPIFGSVSPFKVRDADFWMCLCQASQVE